MKTLLKRFAISIICVIMVFGYVSSVPILAENSPIVNTISDTNMPQCAFIIDAGHGGMDGGASAEDGTLEKDLNLALAWAVSDILNVCGYESVMTRTSDVMLGDGEQGSAKMRDLAARLDVAKGKEDGVFVSIHMNKFPLESCHGMTVYYSPNNPESEMLGNEMKENIKTYIQPDNTREMKKADSAIYILNRIECPAILVECGFLSNTEDLRNLKSEEYRSRIAAVISTTLMNHKGDTK